MGNILKFIDSKPEFQTKFETVKKRVAAMSKRYAAKA
jgi:hypothetical protein